MLARALPLVTGAALAAALVLSGVALWQTARLVPLRPEGPRLQALVLARGLRPANAEVPWPVGIVRLHLRDPDLGTLTLEVLEPPASLVEIWQGATVDVSVTPGEPPRVAFWPARPESRRRSALIALALALGIAAVSALASRLWKIR